ncbi:MAG TPA: FAD binding domain-containing protein [Pseudonocardiaceae bacterium]|jgi:CO/xanthine dehydrogenase FAD-binding subunit
MDFIAPASLAEALAAKAERPDALPIAGGTDVMVELNFDHRRPPALLDLTAVAELAELSTVDGSGGGAVRIGAGVPYSRIIAQAGEALPGLAMASRTIGSPQIRNRGTVGGNLGSASPAGDAHPPLLASDAVVEVASVRGRRDIPIGEFFVGVKRNALAADELITAVRVPPATGPQQFAKVGTRNAMVIAVCSFALALHPDRRAVGTGIGSAAPTPVRAPEAEEFLAGALDWSGLNPLQSDVAHRFAELVAAAASPIDDVRGSAAYRRHALAVLARRTLSWAWRELCSRL